MTTASLPIARVNRPSQALAPSPGPHWLHVVSHTDPRYGGLSAAVPSVASSLGAGNGWEVSLAAFCQPGEAYRPAALPADRLSFWPTSRLAWLTGATLRTRFARTVAQADALHVHGLWEESTAQACRLARTLGKPYVLSAHGMLEPWALEAKRLKKQIYAALVERANVAGAACLHALTPAEAQQYRSFGAVGPIAVIPNAVAVPHEATPELFLNTFPALRGKTLVLFLSRLHPKKGLDLLVRSWAQVSQRYREAHLVIAGPDSLGTQQQLVQQVAAQGLEGQVTFTGMLAGELKWSALAAAGCYVLPSYSEGLSMALLEAMGMGVPVIATRACNMAELATAGAGWEVDSTADALTAALLAFFATPEAQRLSMGQNGAHLIASHYSTARVVQQMTEVYRYVLAGVKPVTTPLLTGDGR